MRTDRMLQMVGCSQSSLACLKYPLHIAGSPHDRSDTARSQSRLSEGRDLREFEKLLPKDPCERHHRPELVSCVVRCHSLGPKKIRLICRVRPHEIMHALLVPQLDELGGEGEKVSMDGDDLHCCVVRRQHEAFEALSSLLSAELRDVQVVILERLLLVSISVETILHSRWCWSPPSRSCASCHRSQFQRQFPAPTRGIDALRSACRTRTRTSPEGGGPELPCSADGHRPSARCGTEPGEDLRARTWVPTERGGRGAQGSSRSCTCSGVPLR